MNPGLIEGFPSFSPLRQDSPRSLLLYLFDTLAPLQSEISSCVTAAGLVHRRALLTRRHFGFAQMSKEAALSEKDMDVEINSKEVDGTAPDTLFIEPAEERRLLRKVRRPLLLQGCRLTLRDPARQEHHLNNGSVVPTRLSRPREQIGRAHV